MQQNIWTLCLQFMLKTSLVWAEDVAHLVKFVRQTSGSVFCTKITFTYIKTLLPEGAT